MKHIWAVIQWFISAVFALCALTAFTERYHALTLLDFVRRVEPIMMIPILLGVPAYLWASAFERMRAAKTNDRE